MNQIRKASNKLHMSSDTAKKNAVPIISKAVSDISKESGISLKRAASFVWKCLQFPGKMVEKFRNTYAGKTLQTAAVTYAGTVLARHLYKYATGQIPAQDILRFTDNTLIEQPIEYLKLAYPNKILPYYFKQAMGSSAKRYIHPFKRFYKVYRHAHKYVYPAAHTQVIPKVALYGAGATAATTLGALALKNVARFIRKLRHTN